MERRNYFEPDNVILVKWVDKALLQSLKKKTIKLGFKVCGIWPLNSIAMVGKFGPNKVFIIIEEERAKNAYQSSAIENSNNSRDQAKVAIHLLNIVGVFQVILELAPIASTSPYEPSVCFYVEMPISPPTPINNQKDELMVNLEDSNLELDDLTIPSQTQGVA